jgi:hypothetical protein
MDIKSAEQSFQNVTFGEDSFEDLLNHLKTLPNEESYHLSLFIGKRQQQKEDALKQMAEAAGRDIHEMDANEIISRAETGTIANLDYAFKKYDAENTILYLKNGSRLCGVYTGYTNSKVKYATPQERYFLKKIQETNGVFVIDIETTTDADTTIRRAAQSIVDFPPSQSMLKKLLRKLKGVSVHGYQIKTKRPGHYSNTSGNF